MQVFEASLLKAVSDNGDARCIVSRVLAEAGDGEEEILKAVECEVFCSHTGVLQAVAGGYRRIGVSEGAY